MIAALLPALLPVLGDLFKRWFPDPAEAAKAQQDMVMALLSQQASLNAAAGDIIKAEAQSEHLLAACWRPILMLTFGGLIVARWLGWSAPGIGATSARAIAIQAAIRAADLTQPPRRGDLLRWAGNTYRVETVEPDPLGLTCRLGLARRS